MQNHDPLPAEPATHVRFSVLATGLRVGYDRLPGSDVYCVGCPVDRQCAWVEQYGRPRSHLLGVYPGVALFEVPNGWLGDVFGPRKVLIRIACWWSVFLALSGVVGLSAGGLVLGGFWTLVAVQFLAGAGEAGAFPNITRSLHNWFPYQERGIAQGAVWMCGRLAGGLTPLVWMLLVGGIDFVLRSPAGSSEPVASGVSPWRRRSLDVRLAGNNLVRPVHPLVPQPPRGTPARQRRGTGEDSIGRCRVRVGPCWRSLATHPEKLQSLGALSNVFLPKLWLVLLHHLFAPVP